MVAAIIVSGVRGLNRRAYIPPNGVPYQLAYKYRLELEIPSSSYFPVVPYTQPMSESDEILTLILRPDQKYHSTVLTTHYEELRDLIRPESSKVHVQGAFLNIHDRYVRMDETGVDLASALSDNQ